MQVSPYRVAHYDALLALFDANTPTYFHPDERIDYAHYLEQEIEDYFVVEHDGRVIGAGGINYFWERGEAYISWDLVDPEYHGQGVGSMILEHRLGELAKQQDRIGNVVVRTSQLVYPYYAKHGFELKGVHKDYWAVGLDMYYMEKKNA